MKKILRDNKGSVSALVVISVLLYSIVLTTAFMQASSKRKMQMESQILAKEAYEKQLDNLDEIRDEINGGAGTKVPAEATAETAPYFPDNTFTKKEGTIDTGLVIKFRKWKMKSRTKKTASEPDRRTRESRSKRVLSLRLGYVKIKK